MKARARFKIQYLFWLAVPPLIWWAVRDLNLSEILAALRHLTVGQLALLVGLNGIILLLFSSRWWLILRAQGVRVPYLALSGYRLASFGVSYFTPGPQFGGEPLQVYLLRTRHAVPAATAVAAVSLDKLFELLVNFSFLLVGVLLTLSLGTEQAAWLVLAITLLPLMYLLALSRGHTPLAWILARMPVGARWQPIRGTATAAEIEMARFARRQPRVMGQALLLSGLTWAALIAEYWAALHFLGAELAWRGVVAVMTAGRLAFLAPTPGGLGALEAGQVLAMQTLGLPPALGLSLALLIRGRDFLLGGLGLWWGGMILRQHKTSGVESMSTPTIKKTACARIPTPEGTFELCVFESDADRKEHLALVMGNVSHRENVLVRVHSECFTGDVLGSQRCDCGEQLQQSMQLIAEQGRGVVIYLRQEGRGIGLAEKLRAYNLQDQGYDTVEANLALGHQADEREYSAAAHILQDLAVASIRLLTNNPQKITALRNFGVPVVERVSLEPTITPNNADYLLTKVQRMDHLLNMSLFGMGVSVGGNGSNGH